MSAQRVVFVPIEATYVSRTSAPRSMQHHPDRMNPSSLVDDARMPFRVSTGVLETVLRTSLVYDMEPAMDARCMALARVAALVAVQPSAASLHWAVSAALAAGATGDDLVEVLVALAPIVGTARVSWVAPELAIALDLDNEREAHETPR